MGFFDSIKKALGGANSEPEVVKGPSAILREAGIDPAGLGFDIKGDGKVVVTGRVDDQATSDRIEQLLGGIAAVSSVDNRLDVGPPPPPPAPAPEPTPEPKPEPVPAAPAAPEPANETPEAGSEPEPEAPAETAAQPSSDDEMGSYTVEPGDSLWKIAQEQYGNGSKYMAIFEANRDILDNPDLIKPGQVLKIPPAE